MIDDIALRYLRLHRLDSAAETYTKALALLDRLPDLDERFGALARAGILHQLDRVAQEQRRFAEATYQKALEIKLEFGDRHGAASTYHQLGIVAQEQRRFAEAEAAYQKTLEINLAFDDRHGAAGTYHQLGSAAQGQRRFAEAEAAYQKALEIFLAFDDEHNVRIAFRSLARLWRETGAESIVAAVGALLGVDRDRVLALFQQAAGSSS